MKSLLFPWTLKDRAVRKETTWLITGIISDSGHPHSWERASLSEMRNGLWAWFPTKESRWSCLPYWGLGGMLEDCPGADLRSTFLQGSSLGSHHKEQVSMMPGDGIHQLPDTIRRPFCALALESAQHPSEEMGTGCTPTPARAFWPRAPSPAFSSRECPPLAGDPQSDRYRIVNVKKKE